MPQQPNPLPSEKQMEVFKYIVAHVERHGFQPSQAEMAEHFGISKSSLVGRLKELASRGLIVMRKGRIDRALVLKHIRFKAEYHDDKE